MALGGCVATAPVEPTARPQTRPAAIKPVVVAPAQPSAASVALASYYTRVQADLLAQGLLRTDGGGPDTPFTADMLARNFETLAFFDEYERGQGLAASRGTPGHLRRWVDPVRFQVEFGASVPPEQRATDNASITRYAARLAQATGHPVSVAPKGNFHVMVLSEDDRAAALPRIQALVPDINPSSLTILRNIPRSIHCLVIAFSDAENDSVYRRAIAIVRAEHPELLRRSCIHEELAQGMGLANDSPLARPSIFNDDDEFALLTTHDEILLGILYDPRLKPGMSRDQAMPTVRRIVAERLGGDS